MIVSTLVGIPFVVLTAFISNHNWRWVVLVAVIFPVVGWLGSVYQGWLGKRLGVDKPPPPDSWDDQPDPGTTSHPPYRYLQWEGKEALEPSLSWRQEPDGTWKKVGRAKE